MARDTRSGFLRALERVSPRVADAFEAAIDDIRNTTSLRDLELAIQSGLIVNVLSALNLGPEFFAPLDRALRQAYADGGDYQVSLLPLRPFGNADRLVVRFQENSPRGIAWGQAVPGRLISGLQSDIQQVVEETLAEEIQAGTSFRRISRILIGERSGNGRTGGIVGLTPSHAEAVRRARVELQNLDPAVLQRGPVGVDGRRRGGLNGNDLRRVRAFIRRGEAIPAADIEAISRRYSDRLLVLRGDMIARTEANAAMNAGRIEAMQQIIDGGRVPPSAVMKVWEATPGDRTRDSHRALNQTAVPWQDVFVSPITGAILNHPHDENAPPGERINCRCTVRIDVDWASLAR